MKIQSLLNALMLQMGWATHDAYIAIPSGVNLSVMLENQKVLHPVDKASGFLINRQDLILNMFRHGQNNQERISGLGEFYVSRDAKLGMKF